MEPPSVAEQRATAVARLKRAASLPRMKDGRRPPMHVEAVSEGERVQGDHNLDEDSAKESEDGKKNDSNSDETTPIAQHQQQQQLREAKPTEPDPEPEPDPDPEPDDKVEDSPQPERSTTPSKKRRSRSRTRSRGSKDFRNKPKPTIITANATESSADELYPSTAGDDAPPSPPLVSPIPSHFAGFPASRLLRSPITPHSPIFHYPGTTPSTPIGMPTLDDIRNNIGLYRSNSAGAARAMAMQKLTGEPFDMGFASSSPTPPPHAGLARNNTVSGGERLAARNVMLNRLNGRIKGADGDQTSGGEEAPPPAAPTPTKRRRRRSRRASSRASGILDDRDDREPPSTSPNTPLPPPSPAPLGFGHSPDRPWTPGTQQQHRQQHPRAKQQQQIDVEAPVMGGRGIVVEDEDEDLDNRLTPQKPYSNLPPPHNPSTPSSSRLHGPRKPHSSDAPSSVSTESALAPGVVSVPVFMPIPSSSVNGNGSNGYRNKQDMFPASPFATPLKERLGDGEMDEDEESEPYRELRSRAASRNAFERDSEISWVAEPVPRMPINDEDGDSSDEEDEEGEHEQDEELELGPSTTPEPDRSVKQVSEHRESGSYEDSTSSPSHTTNTTSSRTIKEDTDETPHHPRPGGIALDSHSHSLPRRSPIPPSPGLGMSMTMAMASSSNDRHGRGTPQPPHSHQQSQPQPQAPSPTYPMRLSVAPNQFDRSPSTMEFPDWEDNRMAARTPVESPSHHHNHTNSSNTGGAGGIGQSGNKSGETTWEKIKGAFWSRSTSSNGRRSRTNSIGGRERRYNTESSVSRESGASLGNGKVDRRDSAASNLSLPPGHSASGGTSPIPLASSADLAKYADSKLAPFPGMKKLEEQMRAKQLISASVPDIVLAGSNSMGGGMGGIGAGGMIEAANSTGSTSSATTRSPEMMRERKLSHQRSDSRLLVKYTPPALASAHSGGSHVDYFSVPQGFGSGQNHAMGLGTGAAQQSGPSSGGGGSLKLPMNREGVKRWLIKKKLLPSESSSTTTGATESAAAAASVAAGAQNAQNVMATAAISPVTPVSPPVIADPRPRQPTASLSDLLKNRTENEVAWDELGDQSRTPTSSNVQGGSRGMGPGMMGMGVGQGQYQHQHQPGMFVFREDMKQTEVRVDVEHVVHDENMRLHAHSQSGYSHGIHRSPTPSSSLPSSHPPTPLLNSNVNVNTTSSSSSSQAPTITANGRNHANGGPPTLDFINLHSPTFSSFPSPQELILSSVTPDPQSPLEEFPARSTPSESYTPTESSSRHSPGTDHHSNIVGGIGNNKDLAASIAVIAPPSPPIPRPSPSTASTNTTTTTSANTSTTASTTTAKFSLVMERLDEILGRGSKTALWVQPIDDPPRRLLLSSPVLQVSNANTVKDRFLFLFTDIMIIAKPILGEGDLGGGGDIWGGVAAAASGMKPNPSDRKFIVKSVVLLRNLRVSGERDESRVKLSVGASIGGGGGGGNGGTTRHPLITAFVKQFGKDPDRAVAELWSKAGSKGDAVALGQLIHRSVDLDRVKVGEYLCRRATKSVLKAYVDAFGFTGLRIDKALRAFLLSVCIPHTLGALEHLLDSFTSRWYEANARIVAFDKDQAIRLVRAISQLNDVMYGGIAQTAGITPFPRRNVISRDFVEAFKRPDPRCLVPEELLEKIYASIRRERLAHARNSSSPNYTPDFHITVKRPIPPRLTYRLQSEPVVLRIPQPDPQLTIQLFGQDLVFDPPVLSFGKSAEASFRVTGTSLGPKTIIMWRTGPNALLYSGLPLSSPLVVERSFMRYTFQLAFPNHRGEKRRYMFSVDDSVLRHQWVENIRHQIEVMSTGTLVLSKPWDRLSETAKAYEAAELVAFKVLQDTLIQPDEDVDGDEDEPTTRAVDHALARLTNGTANGLLDAPNGMPRRRRVSSHGRSKSRSQVYHRVGAGKEEPELEDEDSSSSPGSASQSRSDVKMWSVHELTVICRQNSSIAPVLAFFQTAGEDANAS